MSSSDPRPSNRIKRVLVLCTGNSCRSHMAEALINTRLEKQWKAYSAGTEPAGYVHPRVLTALGEIGIAYQGESKHVDVFRDVDFDLVITVCDSAAESCPTWLGKGDKKHIGFPDPAKAEGTTEEIMAVFRQVRNDIDSQVIAYLRDF